MEKNKLVTIQQVYDTRDGIVYSTPELLERFNHSLDTKGDMRKKLLDAIDDSEPIYLCASCMQPVRLNGGRGGANSKALYFKHHKDHDGCIYTDDLGLTPDEIGSMKFHGKQEGALHYRLKKAISKALSFDGYEVFEEKRVTLVKDILPNLSVTKARKLWRQPDIRAIGKGRHLIFEIQLATTSVNVIRARMNFYKECQMHILWVVDDIDVSSDDISFTKLDTLAMTNRNLFQLDDEMIRLSKLNGTLYMKCWYRKPIRIGAEIEYDWQMKVVTLDDLTYDDSDYIAYYFDCKAEEEKLNKEINKGGLTKRVSLGLKETKTSKPSQDNRPLSINRSSPYDWTLSYEDFSEEDEEERLDLDEVWASTSYIESFVDRLKPFEISRILQQSNYSVQDIKALIHSEYTDERDVELMKMMYLDFLSRIDRNVLGQSETIQLRTQLETGANLQFFVRLTSYAFRKVVSTRLHNLPSMTNTFKMKYSQYAHIVIAMINECDARLEAGKAFDGLADAIRTDSISLELDDLAVALFPNHLSLRILVNTVKAYKNGVT